MSELGALCEVAGDAVDRLVLTPAESLHAAIATRVFKAVGPASAPTRLLHDAITRTVYATLRTATHTAARAVATLAPNGKKLNVNALGALNALVGDELQTKRSELAIQMSLQVPTAGARRLAILIHGLAETEAWWKRRHPSFAERLQRDHGIASAYLRYNSGLPVTANGAQLAELLEAASDPDQDLILIGHSMGGLVARAAIDAASAQGHAWPHRVRHLVTLGTPHTGAPLAKAVHAAAWALDLVPETRPLARILEYRSQGIRDLRSGYLPDQPLPACRYTFIAATVTESPNHPLGWTLGDLLVRTRSAAGRHGIHVGGLHHFDLLDHPRVYEVLSGNIGQ